MPKKNSFNIMAVVSATAGGAAGAGLMHVASEKIDFLKDKPKVQPLIPVAVGAGLDYFTKGAYHDFCMGLIGAGGADLTFQLMAGKQETDNPQTQGVEEAAREYMEQTEAEFEAYEEPETQDFDEPEEEED